MRGRVEFVACATRAEAYACCPWAWFTVDKPGGFWCFETYAAFKAWKNAK